MKHRQKYNGLVLSNKKEGTANTPNDMDESHRYAEQKADFYQRVRAVWFSLSETLEKTDLIHNDTADYYACDGGIDLEGARRSLLG